MFKNPFHSWQRHWVAFTTIVTKEFLRFMRIWIQTLLPPVVTTALYFIIFGRLIGDQIGPMAGLSYSEYIMPGLVLMTMISNAYANVVSSFFSAKFQRHIEEMIVSPLPNSVIILGFVTGEVARGLVVGAVVTGVASFFVPFQVAHPGVMLAMAVLTVTLFSLAGLINAIFAKTFDDVSIIPTFVLTPLTYLGGVFYTIELLPPVWQTISLGNPILYMVNTFRYGLFGVTDVDITVAFVMVLGFIVALYAISLSLLNKGVGTTH